MKSFLRLAFLVFAILGFVISAWSGYTYFFPEPFSPSSLVRVSGRVNEVAVRGTSDGDATFVELRLEGNPRLFRMSAMTFGMVANRDAFLADLRSHPAATLGVDSASFREPSRPIPGNLEPATWVTTIATPLAEYVTAANWVEWHRENHQAAGYMAVFSILAGCFLLFMRNRLEFVFPHLFGTAPGRGAEYPRRA
jgi:hypothetical protein